VDLYYMRARWYEPRTGRFLSEDPVGLEGGINPYVYAGNDPINAADPTGRELVEVCRLEGFDWFLEGVWIGEVITHISCWWEQRGSGGHGGPEGEGGGTSTAGAQDTQDLKLPSPECIGAMAGAVATSAADAALGILTLEWLLKRRGAAATLAVARRAGTAEGASVWARAQLARVAREGHRIYRPQRRLATLAGQEVFGTWATSSMYFVAAQLADANINLPRLFAPGFATDRAWDEAAHRCYGLP
jgi:uncharacterized protein RhaS with RHS repeats